MGGTARTGFAADDALPAWGWLWIPVGLAVALPLMAKAFPSTYRAWVLPEYGILELAHVLIPLASAVLAVRLLFMPEVRRHRFLRLWLGLALFGCVFVAGEEASWGQHYAQWATPEFWQAWNDQGETNLHNTSAWFDQKPRLLLEIGVIVGGIILPIVAWRRPHIWHSRLAIILPSKVCVPSAILAEGTRLSERLLQIVDAPFRVFERASEVQETYFYIFVLIYLALLRLRLRGESASSR